MLSNKWARYDTGNGLLNMLWIFGNFNMNTKCVMLYYDYTRNLSDNDMGSIVHSFDSEFE